MGGMGWRMGWMGMGEIGRELGWVGENIIKDGIFVSPIHCNLKKVSKIYLHDDYI